LYFWAAGSLHCIDVVAILMCLRTDAAKRDFELLDVIIHWPRIAMFDNVRSNTESGYPRSEFSRIVYGVQDFETLF
jgi:hypothetical protein